MEKVELERKLGLLTATMIGIGGTLGAGIFVLIGTAAGMAGPGVVFSFILGAFITLFTAINYSELSAAVPVSGGGYTFTQYAIGKFPSFLTGWFMWFGNMFYCALCAVGLAHAIQYFMPTVNLTMIAVLAVLVFAAVNMIGTKETGALQNSLIIAVISILAVFILSGFIHGFQPGAFENWTPKGIPSIFTTVGYIYVCYIGFEIISTVSEEIKEPGKNLPKSIILAFSASALIYCLIAFVAVGVVRWDRLGDSPTPLTLVASEIMGNAGGMIISASTILAALAALNAAMIAAARITYALARDRYLPSVLNKVHRKFGTPYIAVISSSALIAVFAASGMIDFLSYASDFGYIVGLTLINYSVIWLRRRQPTLNRPFKVPLYPYVPILGSLSSLIVLPTLHPQAIGVGLIWAALGLLIYYLIMLGYDRLRIATGGITLGIGVTIVIAVPLMASGFIPSTFSSSISPHLLLSLLGLGVIQIVAGIVNVSR